MRAFADNRALAEVSGINTSKIITSPGSLAGFLAGLAGILYATPSARFNPNFGITLLLSLFAATVLGGIGNAYGALVGGLVIGLSQEWSTLLFNARWKPAVGFALLILILLFMPQGIFGQASAARHEHRFGLLDRCRCPGRHLRDIHAWPAAECRASPACIISARPGSWPSAPMPSALLVVDWGWSLWASAFCRHRSCRRGAACSSACPRCACGPTISPSPPLAFARDRPLHPAKRRILRRQPGRARLR